MKYLLLTLFLFLVHVSWAQQKFTTTKPKNHSIGFYAGFSAFENYNQYHSYRPDDTYRTLNPDGAPSFMAISNLFSLSYKYKKHEIIPVLYLSNYYTDNNKTKTFLMGGALSYLYHFSTKRAHLFFETNFQTYFYTAQDAYANITPYGSSQHQNEWVFDNIHAAHIQNYVLNAAIGIEVKLWPLTYFQFACGSGAFYMKGKSALPSNITSQWAQWGLPDDFRGTYPGMFGFNWYGRLSIIVRGLNF